MSTISSLVPSWYCPVTLATRLVDSDGDELECDGDELGERRRFCFFLRALETRWCLEKRSVETDLLSLHRPSCALKAFVVGNRFMHPRQSKSVMEGGA